MMIRRFLKMVLEGLELEDLVKKLNIGNYGEQAETKSTSIQG